MPFWIIALVILGATIALNALMASRIKPEKRKAAGLGDFNFPTAQENREIPVIVGTVRQKGANSVWHGDLKTVPVKKSVPNPMFFGLVKTQKETGQYRYFVGMALVLGQGEGGVKLKEFQIDDKVVWSGNISQGSFAFDKSNLFGGEDKEGGYAGTFDYYSGTWTQVFNNYLNTQLVAAGSKARNWKGITWLMQRGPSSGQVAPNTFNGYVGLSENIKAYSFILQRFPDKLGQSQYTIINQDDANPIEWAYEVLTNFDYGANIPSSQIDLNSFRAAAQTVFNEGLGCSELWDTDRDIMDVLNDINEMIDGAIFVDRTTGLWTCKLARADYDPNTLFVFDEDNVEEEIDFSTNTGKDAPSEILVSFVDKTQNHKTREAGFKNLAIRRNQAAPHQKKEEFYGVANGVQASRLSFRESRIYASNLRKITFKCNREGHWVRPMSVFKYRRLDKETDTIQEYIFRCARVDDGEFIDGFIEIEALQDVFSLGTLYYSPPNPTTHQPVNGNALDSQNKYLSEQPYLFSGANSRLWGFASQPSGANRNFDLYLKSNSVADYILGDRSAEFSPTGLTTVAFNKGANTNTTSTLIIGSMNNGSRLDNISPGDILANGAGMFIFADTGEICAYQDITDNGDGTYTFNNVWRALLDTTQESHPIGTRVWFFSAGQALPTLNLISGVQYNAKFLSNAINGSLSLNETAALNYTLLNRAIRPLPPANVTLNGILNATTILATGNDIIVSWLNRNRLTQTTILKQSDGNIEPETLSKIIIKVFSESGNLLNTYNNLSGTSWTYTVAMQNADNAHLELTLKFLIYSERNGVTSYQAIRLAPARPAGAPGTLPPYIPSGNYVAPPTDTAISIMGLPVIGQPNGTNQTLVTDGNGNLIWGSGGGLTVEQIQDMMQTFLVSAFGINLDYDDNLNKLVVSSTINAEFIDDRIAQLLKNGVGIALDYNDASDILTISGSVGTTLEDVQDNFGNSFLQAINGITKFYDDANNLLTLSLDSVYLKSLIANYLQAGVGVSLTSMNGNLYISQNTNSLYRYKGSRRTLTETTDILANNATDLITIPTGAEFILLQVQTNVAANIRFYKTAADRLADLNRTGQPVNVAGLIFEVETESNNLTWNVAPKVRGKNNDASLRNEIYATIKNVSGSASAVSISTTVSRMLEGGLQTRILKTAVLNNNSIETGTVNLAKTFELKIASVSAACRLRLYESIAARDLDLNRPSNLDTIGEHGIIAEFIFDSTLLSILTNPVIEGGSLENPPTTQIAYSIQNLSGAATSIIANFSFEEIEI